MAGNNSVIGGQRPISDKVIVVQVLVLLFFCINSLLITTVFMKELFYTTMRYILFASTLLADCLFLFMSNLVLILNYFKFPIQVWSCFIFYSVLSLCILFTPFALTAMTLERYVAICMPLQHGELCSIRNTLQSILIIHVLSSFPCIVVVSTFCASASLSIFTQKRVCNVEMFVLHSWHSHLRSAINQIYFLIMCVPIFFSYFKIMQVAKAASGENKKSTWKGLRTVMLHAFQLLLCLIQLWCPMIEAAVLQHNFTIFTTVRYFDYITFILTPRCLSPLIYGLRDETFFHALKCNVFCGLFKKSPVI
uniref:odorant receptor 131-2-like n=1 Tax=Semicossyphus pulcher TaxID=241346 RepID=UPI0037E70964